MIDDGPKKNEAGKIDFGTASLVVDVHTSFCRIYTSGSITYPRTETALNSPPRHPSGGRRTHLTCGCASECRVAIVRVQSRFVWAVSQLEFGPSWRL